MVSFWRKSKKFDTLYCYRTIRIDKPLLLYPESDGLDLKLFLHLGENKEIFFFTRESNIEEEDIIYNELDL
jgi:hypothetical protein